MIRSEMQVEGRAIPVDLIEENMRRLRGIRRRQHVEAQTVRLELDRQRGVLGDQPMEFGKGAFDKFEGDRDREGGRAASVLRSPVLAAHRRHCALRLFDGMVDAAFAFHAAGDDCPVLGRRAVGGIDQGVAPEIVRARRLGGDAALQAIEEMPAGAKRAFLADMPGMAGP